MTRSATLSLASDAMRESSGVAPDLNEAAARLVRDSAGDDEAPDLIEQVRKCLNLEASLPDVTIAASLALIAGRTDQRERWLAAFGSPVGKHLAQRGGDLNAALDSFLAVAPRFNS